MYLQRNCEVVFYSRLCFIVDYAAILRVASQTRSVCTFYVIIRESTPIRASFFTGSFDKDLHKVVFLSFLSYHTIIAQHFQHFFNITLDDSICFSACQTKQTLCIFCICKK